MKISKDFHGLRFIGVCHEESGFDAGEIRCARCGWPVDPHAEGSQVSLRCVSCGAIPAAFRSQTEMRAFLAESWNALREACTHPSVRWMQSS